MPKVAGEISIQPDEVSKLLIGPLGFSFAMEW